jgi:hypothetical protein
MAFKNCDCYFGRAVHCAPRKKCRTKGNRGAHRTERFAVSSEILKFRKIERGKGWFNRRNNVLVG